jgi:formate-dependent nitrite reductase cytochrome c552 subunit
VGCRTCHAIHTSYTQADWNRIYTDPVPLLVNSATFDLGEANLCASCHQARAVSPYPDLTDPSVTVSITSSRYGYHHGPQSNTLGATGGFEFVPVAGPNTHGTTAGNPNGCVTCHMANPRGDQAGGHTWGMEYEYHGSTRDYTESCEDAACHATTFEDDFDATSRQTNVQNLLDLIEADLFARGIIDVDGYVVASSTTPLVIRGDLAAAFLNWQMLREDRSVGIHSPMWVQGVLQATLDTLTILP